MAAEPVQPSRSVEEVWEELSELAGPFRDGSLHLKDLLKDPARARSLVTELDGLLLDYSRQRVSAEVMASLFRLAEATGVRSKMRSMVDGGRINRTEQRAVLHIALRAPEDASYSVDGTNVMPEVHGVLRRIKAFSERVRSGAWTGVSGKPIKSLVAIGIGGSYLGPQFVSQALRFSPATQGVDALDLRFLANVDPVSIKDALHALDPETTLVIVVSKTFTTAETMLNARAVRQWLLDGLQQFIPDGGEDPVRRIVSRHVVACSTNAEKVQEFGIDPENMFGFWDWVGGRYSVWSAVGAVPLSLQYGFEVFQGFLRGGHEMDQNFLGYLDQSQDPRDNLALVLGLLGVWNTSFLGFTARTLACYSHALGMFAAHVQQVDMESNGKGVTDQGQPLDIQRCSGELTFGEPGTNSQHSYFQLLHQGRVVPTDFIGFVRSPHPVRTPVEGMESPEQKHGFPNHDELMANFFAQPDALAVGVSAEELRTASPEQSEEIIAARVMTGNRPSNVLLLPELSPRVLGKLLALYEHRTAVQGWIWGLNSFDQFGVELGKKLANKVRASLLRARGQEGKAWTPEDELLSEYNPSTSALLAHFLRHGSDDA